MYYMITVTAMDLDGPVGRPVVEQIDPIDVWADDADERLGLLLKSLAVQALVEEAPFRSPPRDLLCGEDLQ